MPLAKRQQPVEVTLPAYGVFLLESHHAPEFRMVEQSHPFLELFFVLSGSGEFRIGGDVHRCRRNDLVIVPPRQEHVIHDDAAGPLSLYAVCVAESVARHEADLFRHLPAGCVHGTGSLASEVRASFRRILFEQTRARSFGPTFIVGLTLQLLAAVARHSTAEKARAAQDHAEPLAATRRADVERYVVSLTQRFFERTNLDEAAAELGMSRRRFTTLFAEVTGRTWAEYLTYLRVEYAKTLLQESPRSIVSIAFECGYEDLSSFYRSFKRAAGVSPGQWREDGGKS